MTGRVVSTHPEAEVASSGERRAGEVTWYVAQQVKGLRRQRRMSARVLAERMSAAGCGAATRQKIANFEAGRVTGLPVDDLVAMATALDVPVARLLPPEPEAEPAGPATPVQVLDSVVQVLTQVREALSESG